MAPEYRLTGRLEGGELAELYRAEKIGGSAMVVKLFHPRTTDAAYARSIAETQNKLLNVAHPSIAQVIDIGIVQNRLAIVRNDHDGFTLGQALQRLNTREVVITSALAMSIVIELLETVQAAHAAGVLHGAMTPGNVLLSMSGRPSVCDFGALAALAAVPALRKNFSERGRSSYRAPEVGKGEGLTIQSDVYSLGAMMYELLTLKEPSTGAGQVSTRRDLLPPPSRIDRRLNSRIDPIVLRALDPVAGRRYRTTAEFASALREFLTQNGGLPARDELARMMIQLFPPDVANMFAATNALPFETVFTLETVDGAHLEELDERSVVVSERQSFSGGTLEMPAITADEPTGLVAALAHEESSAPTVMQPRPDDWHAPPASMPPGTSRSGPKDTIHPDVLKRVKHIEDFEPRTDDTIETPRRAETTPDMPRVFPGRPEPVLPPKPSPPKKDKSSYFAVSGDLEPRAGDGFIIENGKRRRLITEERNIARIEKSHRKWIPIVFEVRCSRCSCCSSACTDSMCSPSCRPTCPRRTP